MRRALRLFVTQPGFTAIIVLMIAVGIGATAAVFSVVKAVLLQPLPYPESERLVWVWSVDSRRQLQQWVSYPDFLDWRAQSRTVAQFAGLGRSDLILSGGGEPQRLRAGLVTTNFFTVLGTRPALGVASTAETGQPALTVVLSHGLWERRYGSDPTVVGRTLVLGGRSYIVLGIMPRDFRFPLDSEPLDLWVLIRDDQFNPALRDRRDARLIEVVARLAQGASVQQAQAEMDIIAANLRRQYPITNTDAAVRVVPALDQVTGSVSAVLVVLFAGVACVLLIACVNVANLLLARATGRQREAAVHAALGASRWRIARQFLIEGVPLCAAGGILGGLLAMWGVDALTAILPAELPRSDEIVVDPDVLIFTILLSLLTGIAVGVAPAWTIARADLASALGRVFQETSNGRVVSRVLVVGEIAVAMVLLAGAGLLVTSFVRLNDNDPGFEPEDVLTLQVSWSALRHRLIEMPQLFDRLQERLQAIPGVRGASAGLQLPDRGAPLLDEVLPTVEAVGRAMAPGERLRTALLTVQPGYFRAMGIPLVAGREFGVTDQLGAPLVAVINTSLARAYFGDANPVGQRIALDAWTFGRRTLEIVGVSGDVKHRGLTTQAAPLVQVALAQFPVMESPIVVKIDRGANVLSAVRAAVQSIDPDQPIYDVQMLEDRISRSLAQERFGALLLGTFAAAALLLAAGGLYGLLSYMVARRTREVGIRVALGAESAEVSMLVLRQGLTVAAAGITVGLIAAFGAVRLVEGLLFGVTASDPITFAGVTVLLAFVALLACWIPARRASRLDPLVALRHE